MLVVVDTSIWSLLLRRRSRAKLNPEQLTLLEELKELGREDRIVLLGVIRQELLTGIRSRKQFKAVRDNLRAYDDYPLAHEADETAAECANKCLDKGVITSSIDVLICTVAYIEGIAVFSSDPDLKRICEVLKVKFHEPRGSDES